MAIKKISAEEARQLKGDTDWSEIDRLSDSEIEEAARNDPDSALPTEEELKKFKRANFKKEK